MGADSRMYSHPSYQTLKNVKFINWPSYKNEQSITQLASRIIIEHNISKNQNIGGSSLGGIVACEITKQINVNSLFLIGSTQSPANINISLKKLSNFSKYAPIKLIQFLAGKTSVYTGNIVLEMFNEANHNFIKNMSKAIFEWSGNMLPNCKVYAIHGKHDTVIRPPKGDVTLINGGHLIAITHANEVAKFIG